MKKIFNIFICIIFMFGLAGCGKNSEEECEVCEPEIIVNGIDTTKGLYLNGKNAQIHFTVSREKIIDSAIAGTWVSEDGYDVFVFFGNGSYIWITTNPVGISRVAGGTCTTIDNTIIMIEYEDNEEKREYIFEYSLMEEDHYSMILVGLGGYTRRLMRTPFDDAPLNVDE